MKLILIAIAIFAAGALLGSHTYSVPLRSFSVDSQGNQHCSGLRHNERFEVFCLSTERPLRESWNRDLDRQLTQLGRRMLPPQPAAEDYRAPWYGER